MSRFAKSQLRRTRPRDFGRPKTASKMARAHPFLKVLNVCFHSKSHDFYTECSETTLNVVKFDGDTDDDDENMTRRVETTTAVSVVVVVGSVG